MRLPEILSRGIRAVLPMGPSWAVLTKEGMVMNFAIERQTAHGEEPITEPLNVRRFLDSEGSAVDLGNGGYSPLVKHADGHWSSDPSLKLINSMLRRLHEQGNESFSVFHSMGNEGILWIEPVK
jgi:hypothetical protein